MQHEVLTPTEGGTKKRHSILRVLTCFCRGLVLRTKTLAQIVPTSFSLCTARANLCRKRHEVLTPTEGGTKKDTQFWVSFFVAPSVGLEPTTLRLTAACSTDWAIKARNVIIILIYAARFVKRFKEKTQHFLMIFYFFSLSAKVSPFSFDSCSDISSLFDFTP